MKILPINLDHLIHQRSVESARIEFKKGWSEVTLEQTIRTICAYANDFLHLNGGYIVLGIEEKEGLAILPPTGLDGHYLDQIQKKIRGQCKRIDPEYQPVLSPEVYQNKHILVIWAPAGDGRPYQAPKRSKGKERCYYIKLGSETIEAQGHSLTQLLELTAKIPFDDRRNISASLDVISSTIVRNFLANINSDLVSPGVRIQDADLYKALRITVRVNDHEVPRNVALLFFTNNPEEFMAGVRIEVVQFGDDAGGNLIEEKVFRGPLDLQTRQALDYLNTFSTTMVKKVPGQAETLTTVAFPYEAMEEALVNAVYHRSYEIHEPIKVYLYPDRMEIISYPGPVPGIEKKHLTPPISIPPVQSRNRRIGEFLKELRLAEGRGTGIPKILRKMYENGSPEPQFEFDEAKTYFRVILPAHPQYIVVHALRESAHLWAVGEKQRAVANLETAHSRIQYSGELIAQIIEYRSSLGEITEAEKLFQKIANDLHVSNRHLPFLTIAKAYLNKQNPQKALEILSKAPQAVQIDDRIEMAVLFKRTGQLEKAHQLFSENYDSIKDN
ncbi:MAG: ATP-binding protein, partial [bacterium]